MPLVNKITSTIIISIIFLCLIYIVYDASAPREIANTSDFVHFEMDQDTDNSNQTINIWAG